MKNNLSTQPYKGSRDFYPEDILCRNYIFDTWRRVCRKFGFEEYDFPLLENFEVFASKTGEEIVNTQLYSFEDRGGRKVAIRPELTPSTVRMIAGKYNQLQKPLKWFMIGNNWRFEKPQRGRGREFYQLEANIFGVEEVEADFEIMQVIVEIMREFGANEKMFKIYVSDRRLITALLKDVLQLSEEQQVQARRVMDKWGKLTEEDFCMMLKEINIPIKSTEMILDFMTADLEGLSKVIPQALLDENLGYQGIQKLFALLKTFKVNQYFEFDPSIIRGFDYSDGLVYEVFDQNPTLRRSLFGGERFDRLINIFGDYDLAATGFAMGDIPIIEFLKNWNLLPQFETDIKVLVTVFSQELFVKSAQAATQLRNAGINTQLYLTPDKLDKQLKYADKMGINYAMIIGPDESVKNVVTLKNLSTRESWTVDMKSAFLKMKP